MDSNTSFARSWGEEDGSGSELCFFIKRNSNRVT